MAFTVIWFGRQRLNAMPPLRPQLLQRSQRLKTTPSMAKRPPAASQNPTKAQATTGRGRGRGVGSGGPAAAESSTGSSGQLRVHWETTMVSGCTSKLVRWLVDHLVDCVVLFSEDKGAPRPEGRASGKTKQEICSVIARIVFEKDDEYGKVFKSHPTKFTDAVQNRLTT
ncbi:hypothetical protein BDN67DRAFT_1014033 [Paxillus ammoniavirescens]|nr:hypothetical protein BDN67DRAFT_1014033 [Paxillus ammoniavirescens]